MKKTTFRKQPPSGCFLCLYFIFVSQLFAEKISKKFSSIRIDVLNVICNLMFTMRMHWLNSRYGAVE